LFFACVSQSRSREEAKQLIKRTYDPRLTDAQNKQKLDSLIKQMETQAKNKQRAVEHFEKFGSLKGFKGSSATSLKDFDNEIKKNLGMESDFGVRYGKEEDGYIYMGGDPSKPGSWRKK
jgi:uncharacterized protein (UPF0371 family)